MIENLKQLRKDIAENIGISGEHETQKAGNAVSFERSIQIQYTSDSDVDEKIRDLYKLSTNAIAEKHKDFKSIVFREDENTYVIKHIIKIK